jgi:acyl-CoA synthetase (AMP-forming)/AMP-acid ligase II/acyl carrier protein
VTFNEVLQQRARERGTSRAFTFLSPQFEATHMTYGELHEAALRISSGLRACKLVRGARVLVALPPGLDFITAFMGCAYAGYVPVHGPLPRRPLQRVIPRLKTILGDCGITTAIMPSNALPMLGELAVALPELSQVRILWFHDLIGQRASSEVDSLVNEKSILFIQYTSGSLAAPKGVMVSHANVLANCRDIAQPAGSTIVCWLPSFHDFGLIYGILTPIFSGVPSVLMSPSTFLQRPRRWLEAMTEYRGTHTPAPNFAFDLCVRHIDESQRAGLELSSWRTAINAAEPIRAETMRRFVEAFAPCGLSRTVFVPAYGLAEATLMVSHAPECMEVTTARVDRESLRQGRIVPGGSAASAEIVACGVPKSSTEFAIVDPRDQRRLLSDQVGEIWIRGPSIALGYFGKPDETEATFGAYLTSGEGPFLRTGDLGFERAGNLYVTGRLKDMVILNGVNHYPHDIELTVEHCHARIRQGSVVAFAIDTDGAEQLAVVAELQRGSTQPPNEVIEAVRRSVSEVHGAAVAHVVFAKANAIPRTTSGKLRRSATREAFLSGALALAFPNSTAACPTQRADQVQLLDELALHLRRILNRSGHDSLDPSQPIVAYGIDSVVVAELIATVQRKYGVSLEPAELLHASLSDVANRIAGGAPVQPNTKPSKPVAVSFAIAEPEANGRELPESMPSGSTETCFSVFYFGNFTDDAAAYYRLVQQTATLADEFGFHAVWLPERHFHAFGGLSPNPAILAAMLATRTQRLRIRAGSVILPLHHPLRVAEEWSVIDNRGLG